MLVSTASYSDSIEHSRSGFHTQFFIAIAAKPMWFRFIESWIYGATRRGSKDKSEKRPSRLGRYEQVFLPLARRITRSGSRTLPAVQLEMDPSVPFFCESALAINGVRLAENGVLPKSDIRLRKVAKILHFLATFLIHPCTFVSHPELMLSIAYQLVKLRYKLIIESQRLMSAHPYNLTTDQKVLRSNHAGCNHRF
jgi:hypothetical protein